MDRVELVAILAALLLLGVVVELVRRRSLREEYALLWLLMGVMILVLSLSRRLLDGLSALIGIYYPPSALFVAGFALVLLIMLHFSTVVSVLTKENKALAQRVALLTWRVERMEKGEDSAPAMKVGDEGHGASESLQPSEREGRGMTGDYGQ